jgi:tyrosine-protein phosphatase SIW14
MRRNLTTTCHLDSASQVDSQPRRNARRGLGSLLGLSLIIGTANNPAFGRGLPAQNSILNFGQVNEGLYRGAQPDEAAIQSLKRLGVKVIIDLRMADDTWKKEAIEAQANGIIYTNVPLRGASRPVEDQVAKALAIIQTAPGPVFVHCQHGCDRTGTVIACYRIQHDGWSGEAALAEARRYGMSKLERGMRAYVVDFSRKPKSTPLKAKLVDVAAQN